MTPGRTNCSLPMVGGHAGAGIAAASANGAPLASQWIGRVHWARAAPRRKDRPPQVQRNKPQVADADYETSLKVHRAPPRPSGETDGDSLPGSQNGRRPWMLQSARTN